MTSAQTTKLITAHTQQWAQAQRWRVQFEAPALVERRVSNGRLYRGRIDVLCTRRWWRPAVAVEIDRANKRWSLEKLIAEADAGHVALWVRWRGDSIIEVPPTVGLVDIRASIQQPG
ncbi:hypothetical protein [Nocardia yunnanensis]|uniref:hypothetical protein n=1 Tax=Nocardia yunnanensis TaxID=2382165 RepID=UPI0013C5166C|nr:hypothetical protein [Nocardia yunnanensis]